MLLAPAITPKVAAALAELPAVFGSVVPTERRRLTAEELDSLLTERQTMDTILKLVKDRKDSSIRTTILNHIDVELEGRLTPEQLAEIDRDADGHYYHDEKVTVPDTGKAFSWEITDGSSVLSHDKLKELDQAGLIDHDLYLEITEPVRVVNEQKLLLAMSKQPEEVLGIVRAASVPGSEEKGKSLCPQRLSTRDPLRSQ